MKQLALLFITLFLLQSCKPDTNHDTLIKEEKAAITSIMDQQATDWNNGDIPAFMTSYWKSGDMAFVGKKGVTRGWQATLERYQKSYPDKAAMGHLTFDLIQLDKLAPDLYHMIGKYTLQVGEETPSGHFTLLWRKIDGEWKIVLDHSS